MDAIKATRVEGGIPQFEGWKFDRIGAAKKGEATINGDGLLVVADHDFGGCGGYAVYVRTTPQYVAGELYWCDPAIVTWDGEQFTRITDGGRATSVTPQLTLLTSHKQIRHWAEENSQYAADALIYMVRELYGRK